MLWKESSMGWFRKQHKLLLSASFALAGLLAVFWTVIFFKDGSVPVVSAVAVTGGFAIRLPFELSRFWDIFIGPLWAMLVLFLMTADALWRVRMVSIVPQVIDGQLFVVPQEQDINVGPPAVPVYLSVFTGLLVSVFALVFGANETHAMFAGTSAVFLSGIILLVGSVTLKDLFWSLLLASVLQSLWTAVVFGIAAGIIICIASLVIGATLVVLILLAARIFERLTAPKQSSTDEEE